MAAVAENGVIGRDGGLPWHLPADLKFFKDLTTGHTVVMGRKTFDEVGKPLPGRRNIVITHRPDFQPTGVEVVSSLEEALARTAADEEVFVIGGSQIYRLALPLANRMYLTVVHASVEGDTIFPAFDEDEWECVSDVAHPADERHAHALNFRRYERRF